MTFVERTQYSNRLLSTTAEAPSHRWQTCMTSLARSGWTVDNVDLVNDLILSREDKPQSHGTVREIARETLISRCSVVYVVKNGFAKKPHWRSHWREFKNCCVVDCW